MKDHRSLELTAATGKSIIFVSILLSIFVAREKAVAQFGIPVVSQANPLNFFEYHPHIIQGKIKVPCPGNDCSHDVYLTYDITEDMATINGHTFIGEWFHVTNNDNIDNPSDPCHIHFTVCSMVQYVRPWVEGITGRTYDTLGMTLQHDEYVVDHHEWNLTRSPVQDSTTPPDSLYHKPCAYSCSEDTSGAIYNHNYWSFYFGCKEMDIAPGDDDWAFDGWHDVTTLLDTVAHLVNDTTTKTITLSQDPPNFKDSTGTDWHYNGQYTDILEGCKLDTAHCPELLNSTNMEVAQLPNGSICADNQWYALVSIKRSGGGGSPLTAKFGIPTGNQVTMAAMKAYPVTFKGLLINAPAGTELRFLAPVDTMSGMAVIDSGRVFTDTLMGCLSDTLGFSFPFLIPAMEDPGMSFKITIPSSCSNGNGRRIELRAEVYARSKTTFYDSGTFMYCVSGTFVRDTTPPTFSNFSLHQVDSNRLEISMRGSEDTTMIDRGYVKYRVNGGTEKVFMLRYESNDTVNHTTKFLDTLVTTASHPLILVRGFIGNQLGLLDSTAMDTCQLLFQSKVTEKQIESLRINYLYIDHNSKTLTSGIQTEGGSLTIDLVTIDGKSMPLLNLISVGNDEQRIVKSFANLANGAYFLVIRSGGELLVRRIIL